MTPNNQQRMQLVAYIQEIDDEKMRRVVDAYSGGSMEKVAKIVWLVHSTDKMLKDHGLAYTIQCLSDASVMVDDEVGEFKSIIEYLIEDTIRVWRN